MGGILGGVASMYDSFYGNKQLQDKDQAFQEKMMEDQFEQMQAMFPFTNDTTNFAQEMFGSSNFGKIQDYFENPTKPSNLERQLFEFFGGQVPQKGRAGSNKGSNRLLRRFGAEESGPLSGKGVPMLEELTGLLQSLVPAGQEWGETGFKTDIQPIQDYAMRMFEREMMPEVAERFGGNIAGSGFNSEMGRTMGDVSSELGAMEVMLNEAAAGRRMQGLSGPIQEIFGGPFMANAEFAAAGAQVGQNYMDRVDKARPGAGLFGLMQSLSSMEQGQNFIQQGYPTSGTNQGNMMSALGQTLPTLSQDIAEIYNLFGNNGSGGNSNFADWDASLGYNSGGTDPTWGFLDSVSGGDAVSSGGDLSSVMDWGSFSYA